MDYNYDITTGARRLEKVEPSPIRTILDRATAMRAQGLPVVAFSAGEPDFDTPSDIKEATIQAIQNNFTHYTSNRGLPELRKVLQGYIERETGVRYDPDIEIVVTSSGAEAINDAIYGFVDPGDDVIVLSPAFMNYKNLTYMCGANFVEVPLDANNGFQIDVEAVKAAITPRTKMLVLNNPSNPTGAVFSYESLQAVCQLAVEHNFLILSDEMYSRLVYDGAKFHSIASFPGMRERSIIVSGFSKTFAMTGWRLGYMVADRTLMRSAFWPHQYCTTCSPTFIQVGLAKAMESGRTKQQVEEMITAFARRRQLVIQGLSEIDGLSFVVPYGAFYTLINVSQLGMTGSEFAERLLAEKYVAAVPAIGLGSACGDYIRISYATSDADIMEGLRRMKELVNEIKAARAAK